MHKIRKILKLLRGFAGIGLLMIGMLSCASFGSRVSEKPIEIPDENRQTGTRAMLPQPTIKIAGLKAVLIGGPIDGTKGSMTTREIENLKKAKQQLIANGVKVYEFYSPNTQWRNIKRAARGAHFILYRGHGVYDGTRPPGWVGGFSLEGDFISSEQIQTELKLAKGAIVMMYGCFTAGNAGFDIGKIDESEAIRRVSMYSKPFLANSFAAYYANWYGDAFEHYIAYLFEGRTLGDAYRSYRDFNADTAKVVRYPMSTDKVLWVDHDDWKAGTVYNNAFAGYSDKTLLELFTDKK